ncbi:MAG: hypothetical protein V3V74_03340, partial [Nitrosomonadaceae bacterium]
MEQLFLNNLVLFGYQLSPAMVSGLRIILIATLGWIALSFSHKLIRTFRLRLTQDSKDTEKTKRVATLGRVFRYIASVLISLITGIVILGELGIS